MGKVSGSSADGVGAGMKRLGSSKRLMPGAVVCEVAAATRRCAEPALHMEKAGANS
jgi:hypothetical protein